MGETTKIEWCDHTFNPWIGCTKVSPACDNCYAEAEQINADTWQEIVRGWRERYGPTLAVPRMNADEHERIDPLSELAEKVHPDKIAVIEAPNAR